MDTRPDPPAPSGDDERERVRAALFGGEESAPRTIGRFEIGGVLGAGGMGEVLSAYDAELERTVAIKLLHADLNVEHRERFKREAKALAKLSHPNVVHVYEVGTHQGQVFIAMEHVPGTTLRGWLSSETRNVAAILDMFIAAGRGLVEAHARGLVHRDFKPDNVLVGTDERPRIVDFGLARAQGSESRTKGVSLAQEVSATEDTAEVALEVSLTSTGAILGTPAYMSPEQFLGEPTVDASDQFSFCVALWEALYGARPFSGKRLPELAQSVCKDEVRAPSGSSVSPALFEVLRRGLAKKAADRWPSMDALLEQLERVRDAGTRRRRTALGVVAGVLAIGGVGWAASRPQPEPVVVEAEDPPCVPLEQRLQGVWDDDTQSGIAYRYTSKPGPGARWWKYEKALLDRWVKTWSEIYVRSCETEAEQDAGRFALRQNCLDQRLIEIKTRVRLLQSLEPDIRAAAGTNSYPPFYLPEECENDAILHAMTPYPEDAQARDEVIKAVTEFRVAEGEAAAAFMAGTPERIEQTRVDFLAARDAIDGTEFQPAIADVRFREGNGWILAGATPKKGFPLLDEAIELADASGAEALSVYAAQRKLSFATYHGLAKYGSNALEGEFPAWFERAKKAGSPAHVMVRLFENRALHRFARGDTEGMLADVQALLAVNRKAYPNDYSAKTGLLAAANILDFAGQNERASAVRSEYVTLVEGIFGPRSIHLLNVLYKTFDADLEAGRVDDAVQIAERMVDIAQQTGDRASSLVSARLRLGRAYMASGEYEKVHALLEELDEDGEAYVGVDADAWAMLKLLYVAVAGEPDDAARTATQKRELYPASSQLAVLLQPILDGSPTAEAERKLASSLAEPGLYRSARGAGLIQWGRLLETQGRTAEAREAYTSALELEPESREVNEPSFGGMFETGARRRLEALE